jgi:hypothetical protein
VPGGEHVGGVAWVDAGGAFARSGFHAGDIPRMQHGMNDFCSALAWASRGEAVEFRVANVNEMHGDKTPWRDVTLRLSRP